MATCFLLELRNHKHTTMTVKKQNKKKKHLFARTLLTLFSTTRVLLYIKLLLPSSPQLRLYFPNQSLILLSITNKKTHEDEDKDSRGEIELVIFTAKAELIQ